MEGAWDVLAVATIIKVGRYLGSLNDLERNGEEGKVRHIYFDSFGVGGAFSHWTRPERTLRQ